MKLSDVVSSLHLSVFAEVPLLIFLGVFIGACCSVLSRDARFDQAARLPLRNERDSQRPA